MKVELTFGRPVNCCWSSPAQHVLVSGPVGTEIFFLLKTPTCFKMGGSSSTRWGAFLVLVSLLLLRVTRTGPLLHKHPHTHKVCLRPSDYWLLVGRLVTLQLSSPAQSFLPSVATRSMNKILSLPTHVRVWKWGLLFDEGGVGLSV
jgi:hypothetical protein